jgi:hypothetical protein
MLALVAGGVPMLADEVGAFYRAGVESMWLVARRPAAVVVEVFLVAFPSMYSPPKVTMQ